MLQDSYNVLSIDFVRTNQYSAKEKETEAVVQIEQHEPTTEKKESIHEKPDVELDPERSMIDIDTFEKIMGIENT